MATRSKSTKASTEAAPRKRESKVDPNETKAAKFVRLAVPRTRRAIKALQAVGKLSARNYEYNADQASKIITALKEAVLDVERGFEGTAAKSDGFTL